MTVTINYMMSRKAPATPAKRRRRIETTNGKLEVEGVWLDAPTRERIFSTLREKHPGWSVGGFSYVSGPHDGEGAQAECVGCGYLDCDGDCGISSDDFPAWD